MQPVKIPTDLMQAILHKVTQIEDDLQRIAGFKIKVRLEIQPDEINEMVLQNMICNAFDVSWAQVRSKNRDRRITFARHAYFFFSKLLFKKTIKSIGREVNRDHTTVLHGIKCVEDMVATQHDPFIYSFNKVHKALHYEAETY